MMVSKDDLLFGYQHYVYWDSLITKQQEYLANYYDENGSSQSMKEDARKFQERQKLTLKCLGKQQPALLLKQCTAKTQQQATLEPVTTIKLTRNDEQEPKHEELEPVTLKPAAKTNAQRNREYRARKRQKLEEFESETSPKLSHNCREEPERDILLMLPVKINGEPEVEEPQKTKLGYFKSKVAKSGAQRNREYRARKRQKMNELEPLALKILTVESLAQAEQCVALRPAPKTPAQRAREYRERQRQLRDNVDVFRCKPPAKTSAQRSKEYRERKRQRLLLERDSEDTD